MSPFAFLALRIENIERLFGGKNYEIIKINSWIAFGKKLEIYNVSRFVSVKNRKYKKCPDFSFGVWREDVGVEPTQGFFKTLCWI